MIAHQTKTCLSCKISKHIDSYNRVSRKDSTRRDYCKQCERHEANKLKEHKIYELQNDEVLENPHEKYLQKLCAKMLSETKIRSFKKNIEFDLDQQWLFNKLKHGKCEMTNMDFEFLGSTIYKDNPYKPSIDRIDSQGGYVKNNCKVVCWFVNNMKFVWHERDFVKFCEKIVEAQSDKYRNLK